ncbi:MULTISPECIES: helix-turn-helix domain-containing protein [Klebsiella]|nr:helix-turn-helix transcriptional regulator [Klebsiella michiganensis]ELT9729629.1 helix-turn-helix transcriptional regulator [Klebsiella michiganensis]MBQ4655971.1 helix-turn-helix transcriptional regulator [Klebsiella michiganensis]MBQ4661842.1 helix-turn-helix transcriptional regulator [Klebsiella michiganensis]MBZ7618261.1 helix-turn-helix transcriptional regulator [Klebsiella michiganensis]MCW9643659.1 helix-turn-helix transcriptional regulator [Klebsiella michiganensis]
MSSILDVAVMSPNRYFCLGLSSLQEQKSLTAIRLHFCHDLKSLKTLMESMALSGVLMETFGEGENIYDAFVFGDYLKRQARDIAVFVFRSFWSSLSDLPHYARYHVSSTEDEIWQYFTLILKGYHCNNYISRWEALLTHKEYQVIRMLCCGKQYHHIGKSLGITIKTVSTHKIKALKKLGAPSMSSLILQFKR